MLSLARCLAATLILCQYSSAATLQPVDVTQFFINPDEESTLTWNIDAGTPGEIIKCIVRDYGGESRDEFRFEVSANRTVQFGPRRPQGYYEIEFPESQQRFGLVVLPACRGLPDAFFSIDAAMSWLVRDDGLRDSLVRNLRRGGIAMARERLSWSQVNPAREQWVWDGPQRFGKLRQTYAEHGVEFLEMFHDSPGWPGRVRKYPEDLVATAQAWQEISRHWHGVWDALEVWNEPDIFFGGNLPADQYVPLVKTIAWAQQRLPAGTPLVGGVVAHDNRKFLDCAAANGLLDCVHAASFHTYGRALEMEALIGRYRHWLRTHRRETLPLWLTECGRPWKRGPDRPPVREDAESALDITMKAVEARACGVARYFAFVYPFYEEHASNFGMLDRRGTPLRSMAAYLEAARVLGHKRYIGDLRCDDSSVQRARVFADDRETVAVLYTAPSTGPRRVKPGLSVQRLEGLDGRALQPDEDGSLPLGDGLVYAWLDRTSLGDRLLSDTTAARMAAVGQQTPPAPQVISPIVLRYQFDPAVVDASSHGYRLNSPPYDQLPVVVRIFNLDRQPHEVTVQVAFSQPACRTIGEASLKVVAPAQASRDASWQVDAREAFAKTDQLRVSVTASCQTAGPTAPLVFDLAGEASLEQVLIRYPRHVRLPLSDASAWTSNIVGHGRMKMERTAENEWQLEASFGPGDRWAYPIFRLPTDVDLARFSTLVVRGRCQQPAKVRVLLHEGDQGVVYLTPETIFPADGRWHVAAVPLAALTRSNANAPDPNNRLDLDQVRRISIGMNSDAASNRLEVSAAYLAGEE